MVVPEDVDDMYRAMKEFNMPDPIEQFECGKYTIFIFEKIRSMSKRLKQMLGRKSVCNDRSIIYFVKGLCGVSEN